MKKILFLLAFLSGLLLPALASARSFPDVVENSEHYAAAEYLKAKNVVNGYADGTAQLDRTVSRAEGLKIILLAAGVPVKDPQKVIFSDVPLNAWFYPYVATAFDLKMASGYQDLTFKPENQVRLDESLKLIFLGFNVNLPLEAPATDPAKDVEKTVWSAPYALYAKNKQYVQLQNDGKFHPEHLMTRGEFMELVYRLMYVQEKQLASFPLSLNWPTFTHPTDHYSVKYPFDWLKIDAGAQTVFWLQDKTNGQVSFARIFPNSATVITALDHNTSGLNLDGYLAKLQYDSSALIQKDTLNNYPYASVALPAQGLRDFYFELPNNTILVVYTQVGTGTLQSQLDEMVRYIIGSVRYSEATLQKNPEDFLSEIRKNILVKGKGQLYIDMMGDAKNIETDTIGIGTGPIDYYYSQKYDITVKFERSSDTLLGLKSGKTSAF